MLYYGQIGTSGCTTSGITDLSASNVSYVPLTLPTGTTGSIGSTLCNGTRTPLTIAGFTVGQDYDFVVGFDCLGHQASQQKDYVPNNPTPPAAPTTRRNHRCRPERVRTRQREPLVETVKHTHRGRAVTRSVRGTTFLAGKEGLMSAIKRLA
jgi:hypothetical protein